MVNMEREKIGHVEKYGETSVTWKNFFTWDMWGQNCFVTMHAVLSKNLLFAIYAVLLQNIFVAIHMLLRGEKINHKLCLWRKRTNIRYEPEIIIMLSLSSWLANFVNQVRSFSSNIYIIPVVIFSVIWNLPRFIHQKILNQVFVSKIWIKTY